MSEQVHSNKSPSGAAGSQRAQRHASSGDWELVVTSGIVCGGVFAWSRVAMQSPSWMMVTGVAYGIFITNGNFRYSGTQKAVATLIMLGVGTYWREILHLLH